MVKVMTIVGTRPELIKMSRVIAEFDTHTDHVLVHTGQNYDYELNQVFFDDLGIRKPDHFLEADGKTAAETIANVIAASDRVMEQEQPDAVLLYGDTNSCLSIISAKRRKIPVFHFEAGNRCFDQRVPEEINRKVLDHLADINFVLTEHARRYLIAEGIAANTIIKTGSHMTEVLEYYQDKIDQARPLEPMGLEAGRYFLVSLHREENVDSPHNLRDLVDSLNALAEQYDFPVIVSTHPRTRKRLDQLDSLLASDRIRFMKPFGFCDYIQLQKQAFCVLSDSGTITEETALLGLTAVNVRNAHERPEGPDAGTLIMSGLKKDRILDAVRVTIDMTAQAQNSDPVADYQSRSVSKKVLKAVLSNIDYVNRTVWHKH